MRSIRRTTQFKRDVRRLKRRSKDLDKLKRVIELLLSDDALPERLHDHELTGQWTGVRDLHIESDWLLLYQRTDDELVLIRSGAHADLFS
ncbi:MAG TPA: type II toxin-antitoxin system YafQ family toxin [Rhodothermales bacterium]|nr:type II toxin-antitoxin system YafQ family toxin [Rhodothermales bacterium]